MTYQVPFDVPELSFEEAYAQVRSALRFGIIPTLDTTVELLAELGDPDLAFESLQVAGTNGKTSTARYTAALLSAHGYRSALYTSPELVSYTERMEVGGQPVAGDTFARGVSAALTAARRINDRRAKEGTSPLVATEFELLTVAACVMFAEAGVEVAVLEVGMGGRWDATSAVRSIRAVTVTGIGLDHMHILGDTLEAIAAEKAAVIQDHRHGVLGAGVFVSADVFAVLRDRCREQGVTPVCVRPLDGFDAPAEASALSDVVVDMPTTTYHLMHRPTSLGGLLELKVWTPLAEYDKLTARKPSFQAANIACAIALVEQYIGHALDLDSVRRAVEHCPTPGRFEVLREQPLALVDACHNPQSVRSFLSAVRDIEPCRAARPTLLVAALADKDVRHMVSLLAQEFERVVVCQTSSARALACDELAELFRSVGVAPVAVCPSVREALAILSDEPVIACGSITLAGEMCALLTKGKT